MAGQREISSRSAMAFSFHSVSWLKNMITTGKALLCTSQSCLDCTCLWNSGGARDFLLQVLWVCSAFYRGCYEIRVISYVSHGSLLQHLPTISSYLFTCLLSEASLGSLKSAYQTDCIIII